MAKDPIVIKLTAADFLDEEEKGRERVELRNLKGVMLEVFVKLYPLYGSSPFVKAWGLRADIVHVMAKELGLNASSKQPCPPPLTLVEKLKVLKRQEIGH